MTDTRMPAISLAAVPGRRARTLELAAEIERKGFSGIWCPSFGDPMSLCLSMAHVTSEVELATSIEPIYFRQPHDLAAAAAFLHEVSGGRFRLGLGVSHGPVHERLGLSVGKPLSDIRDYVEALRGPGEQAGGLPPVVLAALRTKMTALAAEIADGAVWANASRSHMAASLEVVPADRRDGFIVTDMIPTVVDDDRAAAAAVNRKTLSGYVALPNYRNYWKEAGYVEEMNAIEKAIAQGRGEDLTRLMSDRWLADVTLFGSAAEVRDGVEAWREAGVTTPILVPSSAHGNQVAAFEELFAAFAPR
jgi:probable F420-dependent oxidoreductase